LAKLRITVKAVSPGATEDSLFNTLRPEVLQSLRKWAESGGSSLGPTDLLLELQIAS